MGKKQNLESKEKALHIGSVVKLLEDKEFMDFEEWFEINGYYIGGEFWLNDSHISGIERVYAEYEKYYEKNS